MIEASLAVSSSAPTCAKFRSNPKRIPLHFHVSFFSSWLIQPFSRGLIANNHIVLVDPTKEFEKLKKVMNYMIDE